MNTLIVGCLAALLPVLTLTQIVMLPAAGSAESKKKTVRAVILSVLSAAVPILMLVVGFA